ncbi:Phosphoribosylglycinamide formyltransferase chloroplastic [Euphorbia peplus]|nr:Phosphoribosylglycinamide formyltransferase chloroplastic [Euphorbia peplus]
MVPKIHTCTNFYTLHFILHPINQCHTCLLPIGPLPLPKVPLPLVFLPLPLGALVPLLVDGAGCAPSFFVSGGGSNFKIIHDACIQGSIHGDVVAVVTDKHGCGGAEYARSNKISVLLFPRTKDNFGGLSSTDLVSSLRDLEVDFVLLAGYLKLIPTELIRTFPKCILNIHPALLPAFGGKGYYGMKVHKAVIASGARYSGPTIHFVDELYDSGRILAQRVVPVLANDTPEELAARVLREEHRLYVEVVIALCEERIIWREDGVPLIQSRSNPEEYI